MAVVHLDVSSWRGISIGAVHWYVSVKYNNPTERYGLTTLELERPLTADEAKRMNKEARERGYMSNMYEAGGMTEGFNTEAEAIAAGIKYFKDNFKGILYDSGYASHSGWKKIIAYDPEFEELALRMNKLADRFQALNGYECKKKDTSLVERIDARWGVLADKIERLAK
jgi:hypothetical protein